MQLNAVNKLAMKQGRGRPAKQVSVTRPYQSFFQATLDDYTNQRTLLLRALGTYLHHKHHEDRLTFGQSGWAELQAFARKLRKGDAVITFNYDSTLERVLFRAGMWAPSDGYGFKVRLQKLYGGQAEGYGPQVGGPRFPVVSTDGVYPLRLRTGGCILGWYGRRSYPNTPVEPQERG
jgi:hypothetical protein